MKRKLLMTVFAISAALLTFFATTASASACWFFNYQPQEPKSLSK